MSVYAYVRVSSASQNPERQVREMAALGVEPERVFVDYASGKDLDRPRYRELAALVGRGDVILLDSIDRLGRSYGDVTVEWRRLTQEVGCDVRCLDLDWFDSARFRAMGEVGACVQDMLLSLLAYVAERERLENRRRQAAGIAVARELGRFKGRAKRACPPELRARAEEALRAGGRAAAARVLGCHVNTVSNMLADGRLSRG